MIYSELYALTASMANDKDQTKFAGLYEQAVNLGLQQFSFDSKCCFVDAPYTIVSGTASYDLPSNFWLERRATFKGIRLEPLSRETLEFYSRDQDWRTITGTPTGYIIDPQDGSDNITLFPIPGDGDAGAGNLILNYYYVPTEMGPNVFDPTLDAFNGTVRLLPYNIAVCEWAAWLLLGYDTATPENVQKRKDLLNMYNDKVTEAVDNFGNTASEPIRMRGGRYF